MEITTLEEEEKGVLPIHEETSGEESDTSEVSLVQVQDAENDIDDEVDLDVEEARQNPENIQDTDAENVAPDSRPTGNPATGIARQRAPTCPLDLPISVVRRIMKNACPNKRFSPELIATFSRVGGAFALYLLSACQEATLESKKATIDPVRVIEGLSACGFPELAEEARIAMGISISSGKKKKGKRKL